MEVSLVSAGDVEVVRRVVEARAQGDTRLTELLAPDFVLTPDPMILGEAGTYGSFEDWVADMCAAYPEYVLRSAEVVDVGGGRVLEIGTIWLDGNEHGFGSLISWLVEVRGGRIHRARSFLHQEEARRATGLSAEEWPATSRFAPGDLLRVSVASSAADLLRRAMRGLSEQGAEAIEELFARDFEYEPDPRLAESGPVGPLAETLAYISRTHPSQINDMIALPDNRVLAVGVLWPGGREEGAGTPASWIFEIRGGRIARAASFLDQERARLESGLAPEQWPAIERFTGPADGPLSEVP